LISELNKLPLNIYQFIAKRISETKTQKKSGFSFSLLVSRIAVVSVAVTLLVALLSFAVLLGFKNAIKSKMFSFSGHIRIIKTSNNQSFEEPAIPIETEIRKNYRKIPYIEHLQLYVQKPGVVKIKDQVQGVVLKGVGRDFRFKDFADNMKAGRWIEFKKDTEAGEAVISQTIADKLQLTLQDSVIVIFVQEPPRFRRLRIVGIYESGVGVFDEKFIITDIKTLQKVNNWGDSLVSGYEIFLKNPDKINEYAWQLEEHLPYQLRPQPITAKHHDTFDWLELLDNNVVIVLVIILAVASFNIISVLLIMMMERTNMIGMLKAMGASDSQIRNIFLLKGIRIMLKGFVWGNLLAFGLYALEYYFRLIPLDTQNYYVSYVPVEWDWWVCLFVNVGVFALIVLIMWLPIHFVVRISPVKAIRFV
jgi:lipoprotein-releasing system permease protein